MSEWEWFALGFAAFLAGFIDAVAGGGGLIQVPSLFAALPSETPGRIFGTNKLASIFGTANAAWRYARRITIPWDVALPAATAAFVFSFSGAAAVDWMPKAMVRPVVLVLLVAVIIYTLLKPDFGKLAGEQPDAATARQRALLMGAGLGFYDGFFGPGTGSFLIFVFIRWFGMDFLHATSAAKVVNFATNAAALAYFVPTGNVLWVIGLTMALFNIAGAQLGSRMALRHGSGFVRWVFLVVASILALKFGYDTLVV